MMNNSEEIDSIGATSNGKKVKIILLLAFPAIIENFFQTILGFVDTYFVSKLGLIEVSAVGVSNALLAIYFALFMALGVAANVYIANFIGANKIEKARHIAQQAIIIAVAFGIITGLITLFFAEPLLKLMGIEENVLDAGTTYFRIVAIPSVFMSLMFVISAILRGAGDTKSPMKVSIVINGINVGLDYILIFGFWMIPAYGLTGAAIATVVARMIGAIGLLLYTQRVKILKFKRHYWKPDFIHLKELMELGSPAAGERLIMRAGQIIYFGFVVALGTNVFAAHQIAGNIEVFSYMMGYGFATAATILVGQQIGAGRLKEAKQFAKLSLYLAIGVMTLFGGVLFFAGEWAGAFFSDDPNVINNIGIALKVSGVFQPFLAAVLILTGAFQGANNTKFPMYLTGIGMWAIRTLFVYLLGIKLNMGLMGVWIAIGLDIGFRAIVLAIYFSRDKWIIQKVEPKEDPEAHCHPKTTKEDLPACVNSY
ncbi:MATE family efflux transporter [Alkalihalobacillus sp. CinArs1]|uniref:MATE family efflux transporter n=1 Tax=Alkalihalobacillus sp. CinArs1 TaxID=2995314 RepID=UPI0022DDFA00|nr:MATE family efflux transporter [Alkalihalobacillus sp. CinArs1]